MSKMMRVCLGPDLLDRMSAEDPRAIASRRDIKRINAVMLQYSVMRDAIRRCGLSAPKRVLDLGGGDATFTLKVIKWMRPQWRGVEFIILDRMNVVEPETIREYEMMGCTLKVVNEDVFSFFENAGKERFDLVLSNLFIHHFPAPELTRMLSLIAGVTKAFAACEPKRSVLSVAGSAMLWAIGCSSVTVHDSITGSRAGFAADDVTGLWPNASTWQVDEYNKGLFSHCFVARQRGIA